jgi:hypothetical protein
VTTSVARAVFALSSAASSSLRSGSTALVTGQPDGGERPARGSEIAANADRDLLVRALAQDVAAGILREVSGAALPLDLAAQRDEQARSELCERRLPATVRADERDDLSAAQLEARAVEDEEMVLVGERDLVQPAGDVAEMMEV